jgi:hypothetical protein
MPTARVQRAVVVQPVNLRPLGNTVSMTVPASNPFTGGHRISIHTQVSSGMAQADPSQRSRRTFVPGFSGLGGAPPVSYDTVFDWYASIDPDGKAGKPITPEKEAYWRSQAQADADKKAAESAANWDKAIQTTQATVTGATSLATKYMDKGIRSDEARIAEAKAEQAALEIKKIKQEAFLNRATDASKYKEGMEQHKGITIPLLIIGGGALAVALFLFLKKKGAATAA